MQLDAISALAVAEGGLHSFGITVGDQAITYHFTFQTDGHVYFDGAPEAATPSPIQPRLQDLHFIGGAGQATPTPMPPTELADEDRQVRTPLHVMTTTSGQADGTAVAGNWVPLSLILFTGVTIGLAGFIAYRRRDR